MNSEGDDLENYDTGSFCRHWNDPSCCDEICATCGHKCTEHEFSDESECMIDGCECCGFVDVI